MLEHGQENRHDLVADAFELSQVQGFLGMRFEAAQTFGILEQAGFELIEHGVQVELAVTGADLEQALGQGYHTGWQSAVSNGVVGLFLQTPPV